MWHDVKGAKGLRKKFFYLFGDPIDIANEKKKEATPAPMLVEEAA